MSEGSFARSAVSGGANSGGSYSGVDGRHIQQISGHQGDGAVYTRPEDAERAMKAGADGGVGGLASGWKNRASESPGMNVAPRRHYVNKFSAFFFTEMDKGLRSPYMVAIYFFLSLALIIKIANAVIRMRENDRLKKEALGTGATIELAVPFSDSHNMLFGISSSSNRVLSTPEGANRVVRSRGNGRQEAFLADVNPMGNMTDEHMNAIKKDLQKKGGNDATPPPGAISASAPIRTGVPTTSSFNRGISHGTGMEEIIIDERPPVLIHTEKSEEYVAKVPITSKDFGSSTKKIDRIEEEPADIVILEKVEHDAVSGRDHFFRTVQYIYEDDVRRDAEYDRLYKECENDAVLTNKKYEAYLSDEKRLYAGMANGDVGSNSTSASSSSSTPASFWRGVGSSLGLVSPAAADTDAKKAPSLSKNALLAGTRAYLHSMIKEDHIHGQIKCSSVTRGIEEGSKGGGGNGRYGNCVPTFGFLEAETCRKQLLVLPVAHMLRDLNDIYMRKRFTVFKDIQQTALVVGLRSSELVQNLQAYPHIQIDIIERDPALVRIARDFFGLKIGGESKLTIASDPVQFIQRQAVTKLEGGSVAGSKGTVKMHGSDVGSIASAVLPQSLSGHNRTSRGYDMVFLDALDGKGRLPTGYASLDFIGAVRNIMSGRGVVVLNIPNDDPKYLYNVVQNWRLGFDNQMLLLTHCTSSQNTLLYAFQNEVGRGEATFESVGGVEEFREVVMTFLRHQRNILRNNVLVDLSAEVSPDTFRILEPGKRYDIRHYLPINHEMLGGDAAAKAQAASMTTSSTPAGASWGNIVDSNKKEPASSWLPSFLGGGGSKTTSSDTATTGGSWTEYGAGYRSADGSSPNGAPADDPRVTGVDGAWNGDWKRPGNPTQNSTRNW